MKKVKTDINKAMAIILSFAFLVGIVPTNVLALEQDNLLANEVGVLSSVPTSTSASHTYDLAKGKISIESGTNTGTIKVTYGEGTPQQADDNIPGDSTIVITQTNPETSTTNSITVSIPTKVRVKLSGVNINARYSDSFNSYGRQAFLITKDAGAVDLILADGTVNTLISTDEYEGGRPGLEKANVSKGEAGRLTISGDTNGTGSLIAKAGANGAGIGGGSRESSGYITITGGTVTAIAGSRAAGIGGGNPDSSAAGGDGHHITITGGTVTATGMNGGAGIGGGQAQFKGDNGGNGYDITIKGGTVTATAKATGTDMGGGAGIGGGNMAWRDKPNGKGGSGSNISITGGTVTATGAIGGAGIGGGSGRTSDEIVHGGGDGSNITITGGTVTATGGAGGAAIGGGTGGIGDGGYDGPGSQTGGPGGDGSNITISGGTVTALLAGNANSAKGIGGGGYTDKSGKGGTELGSANNIIISGGNVNTCNIGCVPTAGDKSTQVYKTALAVYNDTTGGKDVSSLAFTIDGKTFAYNMAGASSINEGNKGMVYAYLPVGVATAVYNSATYFGTVTNDNNTVFTSPSYTISVSPSSKDFGKVKMEYAVAPQAQTITIKNTGNNSVTLKQPTSTNYIIGSLSTTKLVAGGEATFTVQPKTGLGIGKYTEAIEVTVEEDLTAKQTLNVNFEVVNPIPTISWENPTQTLVYTGTAAAITAPKVSGDLDEAPSGQVTYKYKGATDTNFQDGLPTNVGAYTVVAFIEASGDYEGKESDEMTLAITPKELKVKVEVNNKPYDGLNTATIKNASLPGVASGDTVILVNGTATFASITVGNGIAINFTDFTITGKDADNYTITQPTGITANIVNEFTPVKNTHYSINSNDWLYDKFVITAKSGYKLSLTNTANGTWNDTLEYSNETNSDSVTFYVKETSSGIISVAVVETYKIDKNAPTITVTGNTITVKQSDKITIAPTVGISGVLKVEVQKDGGDFADITSTYASGYTVTANGTYTFKVTNGANVTATTSITYNNIDTIEADVEKLKKMMDKYSEETLKTSDEESLKEIIKQTDELLKTGNVSDDDKNTLKEIKEKANSLITIINKVKAVQDLISKIPETVSKNDKDIVNSAQNEYDKLTDLEKKMLDQTLLNKLKNSVSIINKSDNSDSESPMTGDTNNMQIWIVLLFVSGGIASALGISKKRKKANSK